MVLYFAKRVCALFFAIPCNFIITMTAWRTNFDPLRVIVIVLMYGPIVFSAMQIYANARRSITNRDLAWICGVAFASWTALGLFVACLVGISFRNGSGKRNRVFMCCGSSFSISDTLELQVSILPILVDHICQLFVDSIIAQRFLKQSERTKKKRLPRNHSKSKYGFMLGKNWGRDDLFGSDLLRAKMHVSTI